MVKGEGKEKKEKEKDKKEKPALDKQSPGGLEQLAGYSGVDIAISFLGELRGALLHDGKTPSPLQGYGPS